MDPNRRPPTPELSALRIHRKPQPNPRRRRAGIGWLLILVLLAGAAWAVWSHRESLFGLGPLVQTAVVARMGGPQANALLTANGYVTARRQAGVTPKVTGRVKILLKDLGDRVRQGEVLAELEDADLLAAMEEVKAVLWVSKVTAERDLKLLEKGIGAPADYDISLAKSQEIAARVKNLEEQLENLKVRSPFDGMIIVKNVEVGETVSLFGAQTSRKSGPIFVVADFNEFEVEADVNEANIGKIRPDQAAEIALDAVPDRAYKGRLRQIVPTADRQKATIQVKVSLLDPDSKVVPEMSAKVTFLKSEAAPEPIRVLAPAAGIVERDGRRVVLVIENDRVAEVPVETGPEEGGRVLILSGLSGGEEVILSPPSELKAGGRVRKKP